MDTPSTLGTRLRFFRERKGWTREDLSSHARVCLSTIQGIETGRNDNPRIKTLARLALPLGTCVGELTEAKEETRNGST